MLAACAAFVPTLNEDPVPQTDIFLTQVDSVKAQDVLDAHFPSDQASPAILIVPGRTTPARRCSRRSAAARGRRRRRSAPARRAADRAARRRRPKVVDGDVVRAGHAQRRRRTRAAADGHRPRAADRPATRSSPDILVGGNTAIQLDTRDTTDADRAG